MRCKFWALGALAALGLMLSWAARAEQQVFFEYRDPARPDVPIKLEGYLHEPQQPNGKTVLMSHGSTGGKREAIAESIKYLLIGKMLNREGYRVVTYMRKGRGKSEGVFTEESGRCDRRSLEAEVADAYPQMQQVVAQVRERYGADKLILMGHSRGGFLSTYFAGRHPDLVLASVNLAGAWSAFCEGRNGGFGRSVLDKAASQFKNNFWAYFENDSYFASTTFNDPNYEWMSATASNHGIVFRKYPQNGQADGHSTPTWKPETWRADVLQWLAAVQ